MSMQDVRMTMMASFFSFFSVINNIFYRSILIFCNYVNIMWELYAQRAKGNKCEITL
jgi:hypothetical protein